MRFKHRSPVVALGALCLVACLSLLPAASGAYPIRWGETGDTVPGDPDQPGGSMVAFSPQLSIRIAPPSLWTRGIFLVLGLGGSRAHQGRGMH